MSMRHFEHEAEADSEGASGTGLLEEAIQLLSSWNPFRKEEAAEIEAPETGQKPIFTSDPEPCAIVQTYKVEPNDSLNSIARKRLSKGGTITPGEKAVELEVEKIISGNSAKYPSLLKDPNTIQPGWELTFNETGEPNRLESIKRQPLQMDKEGKHQVVARESLNKIAIEELKRRGLAKVSREDLEKEMSRLVDLNAEKYPSLVDHPEHIKAGWNLQVWDDSLGPEPYIDWKPWTNAEPQVVTIVKKAERVRAGKDTWLIVEPGGLAITYSGSRAFLYQNARVEKAYPGSLIVDPDNSSYPNF